MRSRRAAPTITWITCIATFALGACHRGSPTTNGAPSGAPSSSSRALTDLPGVDTKEPVALEFEELVTAGAARDARLPLIIAIHGLGDRPERFIGVLANLSFPARVVAPRGLTPWHDGYSWFPIPDMHDPETLAPGIARARDILARFVRETAAQRPTCAAPIAFGFSQGGMLSYALAAMDAPPVAAALPVSGLLPASLGPHPRDGGAPVLVTAFHGRDDPLVPAGGARATIEAFSRAGIRAELREYAAGHTIDATMRAELGGVLARETEAIGCPRTR